MPMPYWCQTAELPAVCAGTAKMRKIGALAMDVAVKLEPKIEAVATQDEAEITIRAKHGFVTSIATRIIQFFTKQRTVD